MATWLAAGPRGITCPETALPFSSVWSAGAEPDGRAQRLHHPLGNEEGEHHGQRQQDVEDGAGQIHPDISDGLGEGSLQASDEGRKHGHPDAAETKFWTASPAICVRKLMVVSPP